MKKITCFTLCLCFITAIEAQWFSNGPYGGQVYCSQKINDVLYIGTENGIFKSNDTGKRWNLHHVIQQNFSITNLFFDDTAFYANIYSTLTINQPKNGMYISMDTGKTWIYKNAILGNTNNYEIVKVNNIVFSRNSDGTFFTSNHGLSWTKLSLPTYLSDKLHSAGNTLFKTPYYTQKIKLYRSIDDGKSWSKADSGLNGTYLYFIYKIASKLYGFGYPLTYTSIDDGVSWQKMTTNPSINPSNKNKFGPEKMCFNGQSFFASNGGNIYVETVRISPGDTQWVYINSGLPDRGTASLFAFSSKVFIGKDDELFSTKTNGTIWSPSSLDGLSAINNPCIYSSGNNIFAGGANKTYYSNFKNPNWKIGTFSTNVNYINDILKFGTKLFASTNGYGIYSSTNGGQTWSNQKLPGQYLYRFADDGTNIFVGSDKNVYKSADNGNVWAAFSTGIPSDAVILDLKIVGSDIYACIGTGIGGKPGLYKSSLSSASWSIKSSGLGSLSVLSLENYGNILYVGTAGGGIYKSTDYAANWVPENTGIAALDVLDIVSDGSNLIAATNKGVWVLYKGNTNWLNITGNLMVGKIQSIAINDSFLYAATEGKSIWQCSVSSVGLKPAAKSSPKAIPLVEIFPNPVKNELYIQSCEEIKKISVTNFEGKVVFSSMIFSNHVNFSVATIPNGIYTITIQSLTKKSTQKLVIQH